MGEFVHVSAVSRVSLELCSKPLAAEYLRRQVAIDALAVSVVEPNELERLTGFLTAHRAHPDPEALRITRQLELHWERVQPAHRLGQLEHPHPVSGEIDRPAEVRLTVEVLVEVDVEGTTNRRATFGHETDRIGGSR